MPDGNTFVDLLRVQAALPLFTCTDAAIGMRVLEALHTGGMRLVEFTNRSAGAVEVFRRLADGAAERFPNLILGGGTILDRPQAEAFHAAGARFIVAPNLDDDVGRYCAEHALPWCPGTGTVTEMIRAHRLQAAVIKVFPADALGGPAFIKAVRGPCGWLRLMPSSGVTLDESNLREWFAAGAFCVGIGSHLIDASSLEDGRFTALSDRVRRLTTILAAVAPARRPGPWQPETA